jgi:excisionase family DNA binding protein
MLNFLTVKEAAKVLRCNPSRVYTLIEQDRIVGAQKFGSSLMIPTPIRIIEAECPRKYDKLKFNKDVILIRAKG